MNYFFYLNPIIQVLIAGIICFIFTSAGASLVLLCKNIKQSVFDGINSISSGIMISAAFFSLLLPAINSTKNVFIVIISFIIMIILAHLLKVEKYYQNKGIVVLDNENYYLKLYVDFENIETIINNSSILINEDNYQYNIISISDLLESNYDNYQIFYLQILNPNKNLLVNNLVINYKILTGRESLIKYIKNIVKE